MVKLRLVGKRKTAIAIFLYASCVCLFFLLLQKLEIKLQSQLDYEEIKTELRY